MLSIRIVKSLSIALGLTTGLDSFISASESSESKETFGGFSRGFLLSNTQSDNQEKGKQSTSPNKRKESVLSEEKKQPTSQNFGVFKKGFFTSPSSNTVSKEPQKGGYQAGTVKTIIKDIIHKVSRIVLKEGAKI